MYQNYFNGDQITLLVVGIPTINGQSKKKMYIHGVSISGLVAIGDKNGHGAPLQNKFIY